jgi:hypothetical protein
LMASNKRRTRSLFSSVDMLLLLLLLTDPLPSWSLALERVMNLAKIA